MIYSIHGKLIHIEPNMAVVECAGVGYKCLVTTATMTHLPNRGEEVTLLTYLYLREDAIELFGFYDEREMNSFKLLITVSGVGPKLALAILSDLSPDKFALGIISGDVKMLRKVSGVGPKLAQRIILELKDKMKGYNLSEELQELPDSAQLEAGSMAEAISALVVLGYSQSEAAAAMAKLDASLPVEELIKAALKSLASRR